MLDPIMVKIPAEPVRPAVSSRSLHIDLAVWESLERIAEDLGRSRNALVSGILRDWVAEYESAESVKKPARR